MVPDCSRKTFIILLTGGKLRFRQTRSSSEEALVTTGVILVKERSCYCDSYARS